MKISLDPVDPPQTTEAGWRILTAAAALFYRRGINATSVDLIVEQAGTTKRTLYQRFGSKDALVASYLQHRAHLWQSYLLDGLAETGEHDPLQVLYELTAQWAERNPRGCAFVNAWAELGADNHPALAVIRAEKVWMRRLFDAITPDDEPAAGSRYLLYEGAQVSASIQGSAAPFEVALAASRRLCALARSPGS